LPPGGHPAAGAVAGGRHPRPAARALWRRRRNHAGRAVPADDWRGASGRRATRWRAIRRGGVTPSRRAPGPLRIAALLVVARLRSFRNGLRLRGRVRTPLLLVTAAVVTSIAYVGLFAQSFAVVV